jgi:glycosyltransferase involved in cell wall biosynthesis
MRPSFERTEPQPNVHRIVPRLPSSYRDSETASLTTVRTLLLEMIGSTGELAHRFDSPVLWFYTPMPAPTMLGAFGECAVVYDCMDELAQFRFAPTELVHRERFLLARADVVFAGGHALADAKARYHDNVHFFGCGVDAEHFSRAHLPDTVVPAPLAALRAPVLGYVGVIDERLDYALLVHVAEHMPHASLVMVGPVVKVDERDLPRRENIHWLGQQPYEALPSFLKGFDVCLMPFALNKATEYINPTKTLEYMASGKPIVSTPVPDVVRNFTPIVAVAETARGYVRAIHEALEGPDTDRRQLAIERARQSSWESITGKMTLLIEESIVTRQRRRSERSVGVSRTTRSERGVRRAP